MSPEQECARQARRFLTAAMEGLQTIPLEEPEVEQALERCAGASRVLFDLGRSRENPLPQLKNAAHHIGMSLPLLSNRALQPGYEAVLENLAQAVVALNEAIAAARRGR